MFSYQPFAIKDEFISADDVLSFEVSPTTITTGNLIILIIFLLFYCFISIGHLRVVELTLFCRPTDHAQMEHKARHPT
jgi:hypothetical protein